MRKKSHIALTTYLIHNFDDIELKRHKYSFYIGSLLPDCVPSFITKRHCIEDTFHDLKEEIEKITIYNDIDKGLNSYYFLKLGVITHFIADYFTYPHNSIYEGNISAHCLYEKELKSVLKEYINIYSNDQGFSLMKDLKKGEVQFKKSVEEICKFIKDKHEEYLKQDIVYKIDCEYIITVCKSVVDFIIHIFELRLVELREKEARIA